MNNPQMQLVVETGADPRRASVPVVSEVAVLVPDEQPIAR